MWLSDKRQGNNSPKFNWCFLSYIWKLGVINYENHFTKASGGWNSMFGVVTCTCNQATFEAEFQNGAGSIPVEIKNVSIDGVIVWPPVFQ